MICRTADTKNKNNVIDLMNVEPHDGYTIMGIPVYKYLIELYDINHDFSTFLFFDSILEYIKRTISCQ